MPSLFECLTCLVGPDTMSSRPVPAGLPGVLAPLHRRVAAIVERNLFAAYVPPPPPPRPRETTVAAPPPPPAFDPAKYTYLTSIIEVDSRPQAWLNVRPTKQTLRLFVGDGITVGKFSGKLVRIADKEIEIESDGKRRVVALGKSLDQAVELPAAGT